MPHYCRMPRWFGVLLENTEMQPADRVDLGHVCDISESCVLVPKIFLLSHSFFFFTTFSCISDESGVYSRLSELEGRTFLADFNIESEVKCRIFQLAKQFFEVSKTTWESSQIF